GGGQISRFDGVEVAAGLPFGDVELDGRTHESLDCPRGQRVYLACIEYTGAGRARVLERANRLLSCYRHTLSRGHTGALPARASRSGAACGADPPRRRQSRCRTPSRATDRPGESPCPRTPPSAIPCSRRVRLLLCPG